MKYYGYARVSTVGQNDTSIEVQLEFLKQRAKETDLSFIPRHEKASGKNVEGRSVFSSLLKELSSGDILGVYDNSRLGRNTEENLKIVRELYNKGIRVQISGKILDLNNPQDELMLSIESSISTFQRKVQLMKSRAGIDVVKASGDWVMRGDLYGWVTSKSKNKTTATIDENAAKNIRYVFEQYANGRSLKSLGIEMEKNHLEANVKVKWSTSFVQQLLPKPLYMGYYVIDSGNSRNIMKMDKTTLQSKFVKSNIYPPIVSEELWWSVFNSWRTIKRRNTRDYAHRYSVYELSSVFKCKCGKGFVHAFEHSSRSTNPRSVYVCSTHTDDCHYKSRSFRSDFMEQIMRLTFLFTFTSSEVGVFFEERKSELLNDTEEVKSQIDTLNKQIKEVDSRRQRLVKAVEEGIMDMDIIASRMKVLNKERDELVSRRDSLQESIQSQLLEIEDLLEEESGNVVDAFVSGSYPNRRNFYLKYVKSAVVQDDCFEIEYMNGKKFLVGHPKKNERKNISPVFFEAYYKDELQFDGKYHYNEGFKIFHLPTTDEFKLFAYKWQDEQAAKVNELFKVMLEE